MVITIGGGPLPVLPSSILYKTACRNRRCPACPLPRYPGEVGPCLPIKPLRFTSYLPAKHQSPILHTAKSTTAPSIHRRAHENSLRLCASGPAVTTSGSVAHNIRIICWCCRENIYLLTYFTYLLTYMTNPTLTPAQCDPFHENTVRLHDLSRDHTSGHAKIPH
jgi:hypothetical protein